MGTEGGGRVFAFHFRLWHRFSGHLEESENHYLGPLVKSADCIGYHSAVPHRLMRMTMEGRERGSEKRARKGGITDGMSCERGRN